MHFQCVRYVASMAVAGLLVGCSGGDESESAPSAARTFTAEGEARRIAVLYRAIRDTSNVLLPYMRSSAELKAMDGTSVGCLTSGTASRTFNPGPGSGVEESLQIQFSNCGESIGLISGQITVMWNSSADDHANGTFKPTWFGTFTVDGMTYNVGRPSPISLSYNTSSGYRDVRIQIKPFSGLQGPSGPVMAMENVQYHVIDDPAATTFQISDSLSKILNPTGVSPQPNASWNAPAVIQVQRLSTSGATGGIGDPLTGGFTYVRGGRTGTLESLTAAPQINAGLLSLTVEGNSSHLTHSGQFDWPTLNANLIFDFAGE